MTYVDKVKQALAYYGGEASLNDIYTYIKEHFGYVLPSDSEQASIRKAIYHNSSDANLFKDEDLFYAVEVKGNGLWGLRDFIPSDNKIDLTEDDESFPEGKQKLRIHLYRERNPKVIREAKQQFKRLHGKLYYQACGFDFEEVYGDVGEDYIEGHHIRPISENDESMTKVSDIVLLCSNCHKMVHRKRPWLKIEELKSLLK